MITWWQSLLIGLATAVLTALIAAFFTWRREETRWKHERQDHREQWEHERQERLDQWQREERQRERLHREEVYGKLVTMATQTRVKPISQERSDNLVEQIAILNSIRIIASAPVRDAGMKLWVAIQNYGMVHDPETGAYSQGHNSQPFEMLLDAERLFLISTRKELGSYQEGDTVEVGGIPYA